MGPPRQWGTAAEPQEPHRERTCADSPESPSQVTTLRLHKTSSQHRRPAMGTFGHGQTCKRQTQFPLVSRFEGNTHTRIQMYTTGCITELWVRAYKTTNIKTSSGIKNQNEEILPYTCSTLAFCKAAFVYSSGSQPGGGAFSHPPGDTGQRQKTASVITAMRVLLASGAQSPEMLLDIRPCSGQAPPQGTIQPKTPAAPSLRSSGP